MGTYDEDTEEIFMISEDRNDPKATNTEVSSEQRVKAMLRQIGRIQIANSHFGDAIISQEERASDYMGICAKKHKYPKVGSALIAKNANVLAMECTLYKHSHLQFDDSKTARIK